MLRKWQSLSIYPSFWTWQRVESLYLLIANELSPPTTGSLMYERIMLCHWNCVTHRMACLTNACKTWEWYYVIIKCHTLGACMRPTNWFLELRLVVWGKLLTWIQLVLPYTLLAKVLFTSIWWKYHPLVINKSKHSSYIRHILDEHENLIVVNAMRLCKCMHFCLFGGYVDRVLITYICNKRLAIRNTMVGEGHSGK